MTQRYAEFFADNEANWDDRAHIHFRSEAYGVEELIADPHLIHSTVGVDRERLAVAGKDVIHLQCHIGTDTLCLKRLGAKRVVGLDLSATSLDYAREIAQRAGHNIEYVHANVFDAVEAVGAHPNNRRFDLVYTGIGAIGWLPALGPWARNVAGLLRPGGRFFIREDHPVSMMLGDAETSPLTIGYPYFNDGVLSENEAGTYTDVPADSPAIANQRNHFWSHPLQDIIGALLGAGLVIDHFEELPYAMWRRFGDGSVALPNGLWGPPAGSPKVPLTFVFGAHKPAAA